MIHPFTVKTEKKYAFLVTVAHASPAHYNTVTLFIEAASGKG
jgi:hypothetical protein